jgi:nuclear pore complex protein Nup210
VTTIFYALNFYIGDCTLVVFFLTGNEFSTLEGVAFEWSIGGQQRERASGGSEEAAGGAVLRFITYRDSPYEAPHGVEVLESRGLRASTVLLEGMKTGSAKV